MEVYSIATGIICTGLLPMTLTVSVPTQLNTNFPQVAFRHLLYVKIILVPFVHQYSTQIHVFRLP